MDSAIQCDNVPRPVAGLRLGSAEAAIKKPGRNDLLLIELCEGAVCAAVFTRNAFCAAPVVLARRHLAQRPPRYLLVNSGNANAGTGRQGEQAALQCCEAVASNGNCAAESVLPFSTGVIGEPLPVERVTEALPRALQDLNEDGWAEAAKTIMTTDTLPKLYSTTLEIAGREITLTGIAKGAGMIRPDMATMLAYVGTDATIDRSMLHKMLQSAVDKSFNRITVDGDTSTNDACVLVATGRGPELNTVQAQSRFQQALDGLCESLAKAIVLDGEGATKLIHIQVSQGQTESECLQVAYTVAHSPLVKTAFFASDPNWGRILAAVGRSGISDLDIEGVAIHLDQVCIVEHGGRAASYTETQGQEVMKQSEITIEIRLGRGDKQARVWTCDFSYDYVRINAEYRT